MSFPTETELEETDLGLVRGPGEGFCNITELKAASAATPSVQWNALVSAFVSVKVLNYGLLQRKRRTNAMKTRVMKYGPFFCRSRCRDYKKLALGPKIPLATLRECKQNELKAQMILNQYEYRDVNEKPCVSMHMHG